MEYRLFKEENFNTSNWTGGKTKQLAIFPEDGSYLERRFVWRLSSATCELEESDFSKLPDFDRVLVVLKGNVVLSHQDVRVARLGELEQDRFDGAYRTKSFGQITDYNLMVAKGNQGFIDVVSLESQSRELELESYDEYTLATQGFYCRDGFATVTINGETVMISEGQQMIVNYKTNEDIKISVMGEGNLVRAQIFYNYHPEEMGATVIPRERATFDDFKKCIYLANTQFRGAGYIFKKLRTQWYDEALSNGIKKIEKLYLTFFVCLLGVALVAWFGASRFVGAQWIAAFVIWILADLFIVSPLMYFAVVPKPVAGHIKDINNLTPYEQGVLAKEMATNERLERLMRKYKHTGMARYDEEGNRLDKTF